MSVNRDDALLLLRAVAEKSDLLDSTHFARYLPAVVRLAQMKLDWLRPPDAWKPNTHNIGRQFSSLLRHVLAKYRVPAWLDSVWLDGSESARQKWFAHVGRGENLRTARRLPIHLTKKMAHFAILAPDGFSSTQALRFGQARGTGIAERFALALIGSRLGQAFVAEEEPFWQTVIQFFALNPMIDPAHVGPIVDFLHAQKFGVGPHVWVDGQFVAQPPPQPGLSMHRRDPVSLVAQVEAWHRGLSRVRRGEKETAWVACGIAGYERVEGDGYSARRFAVTELLSSLDLRAEGTAMRHCVATYASSCRTGRVSIYSMTSQDRRGVTRMVTIEVNVRERMVTQVRSRFNAPSTPLDQHVLNAWATVAGLKIGSYAILRRW